MKKICVVSLITLSVLNLVQESSSSSSYSLNQKFEDPKEDPFKDYEDYKENTLSRKYNILVNKKSEDCYFIPEVKLGRTIMVDFVVLKKENIVERMLNFLEAYNSYLIPILYISSLTGYQF